MQYSVEEIEVRSKDDLASKLENPIPGFLLHSWSFLPADGMATLWRVWIVWQWETDRRSLVRVPALKAGG